MERDHAAPPLLGLNPFKLNNFYSDMNDESKRFSSVDMVNIGVLTAESNRGLPFKGLGADDYKAGGMVIKSRCSSFDINDCFAKESSNIDELIGLSSMTTKISTGGYS